MDYDSKMEKSVDFSGSFSLSSDQVFDKNCTLCEEDNKIKEATCYCPQCKKYFCSHCVDVHNKLLSEHRGKMLDKNAMLKCIPKGSPRAALTTTCEEHDDKLLEMFCNKHNVVCCTVCLAKQHRLCDAVAYVPDISDGFSQSEDVSKVKSNLQDIKQDFTALKSLREEDQTRLDEKKVCVLAQVEETRQMMNAVFDRLEEAVITDAETLHKEYSCKVQTDLDGCTEVISMIEKTIKELEDIDHRNESQLFVNVKKGAENMDAWRALHQQIQDHLGEEKLVFTVDENIEGFVTSLEKLGTFVDQLRQPVKIPVAVKRVDATVKLDEDILPCRIQGSCCLPDGGTLVTDYSNSKLKRLDSTYQVTDCCKIANPNAVCYVQDKHEAAVTMGNYETCVQIVSLGAIMDVVRTIELDNHDCYGIAYSGGLLYVGGYSGNKIHVYDYNFGQHVSTVDKDSSGENMFADIYHIASNSNETRIYIADYVKGLVITDNHFNVIRVIDDNDELEDVAGVCVDKDDNVLVCGETSGNIVMFNPEGDKICTLIEQGVLSAGPQSIAYDKERSRLVITMYEHGLVSVFDVE